MILVVGPGRCGSSAVARVLHETGVNMGQAFRQPDEYNPKGYFEDLELKSVNELFLSGSLTFPEFMTRIRELLERKQEPWGFKDPRLCYLLPFYLSFCPDAQVIRCHRRLELVAASFQRCYGWDEMEAKIREGYLNRINDVSWVHLEMSEHRSDEWIKEQVCHVLKF